MAIQPVYHVYIDFATLVSSKTQPEPKLMHPSVSTSLNKKRTIEGIDDINKLLEELSQKNIYSDILASHNDIRTPDDDSIISSQLKIEQLLNLYMYILLEDFE